MNTARIVWLAMLSIVLAAARGGNAARRVEDGVIAGGQDGDEILPGDSR